LTSRWSPAAAEPWSSAGSWRRRSTACEPRMDYVIAVFTSALLFGYLVRALLRPERF